MSLKAEIYNTRIRLNESPNEYLNKLETISNVLYTKLKIDGLRDDLIQTHMSYVEKEIINQMATF